MPLKNFENLFKTVLLYTLIVTLIIPTPLITLDSEATYWSGYRAAAFMHLLIFRLITGEWISLLQFFTFVTSYGLGLVLGYVNFRKQGESIIPSWIVHGSVNFFSFLALAAVWPRS